MERIHTLLAAGFRCRCWAFRAYRRYWLFRSMARLCNWARRRTTIATAIMRRSTHPRVQNCTKLWFGNQRLSRLEPTYTSVQTLAGPRTDPCYFPHFCQRHLGPTYTVRCRPPGCYRCCTFSACQSPRKPSVARCRHIGRLQALPWRAAMANDIEVLLYCDYENF